jgi:hypothetical protein
MRSRAIRALSLEVGFLAAGYCFLGRHPIVNWEGRAKLLQYTTYRVADAVIAGVLWFLIAWFILRVLVSAKMVGPSNGNSKISN